MKDVMLWGDVKRCGVSRLEVGFVPDIEIAECGLPPVIRHS